MTANENENLLKGTDRSSPSSKPGPSRKPYESPVLQEWGSILELTKGDGFSFKDGDFTGSGAG
jgi:hypothetical protein